MEIKSLISIVAGSESAKGRRLAIRKSWSEQEKEVRRQKAMESQSRLASLIGPSSSIDGFSPQPPAIDAAFAVTDRS